MKLAIPAYQQETTNATADDSEQFNLGHSVTDTPVTQPVVVWLDGEYYGTPDSVDYDNDTVTVTDSGTDSTVHIYYISDAAASLETARRRATPIQVLSGCTRGTSGWYTRLRRSSSPSTYG